MIEGFIQKNNLFGIVGARLSTAKRILGDSLDLSTLRVVDGNVLCNVNPEDDAFDERIEKLLRTSMNFFYSHLTGVLGVKTNPGPYM